MSIKVCMYAIAKDEAKNARDWYNQVSEADKVVVLDTGSSDGTADILRELGAVVESKTYPEFRFDVARNDSLELAERVTPGYDLYLTTDLDERIETGWSAKVRKRWQRGKHERLSYSWANQGMTIKSRRNWGHTSRWKWKYPCHEVMERKDGSGILYDVANELDLSKEVCVWHHRDPLKDRGQYLPLLELRYKEFGDTSSLAYLLRELWYKGDFEGILSHEDDVLEAVFYEPNSNNTMTCLVHVGLAYQHMGYLESAERYFRDAIASEPTFRRAYIHLADVLIRQKKPNLALHALEECKAKTVYTTRVTFVDDPEMWTWILPDWFGVANYWRGDYAQSLINHLEALQKEPGNEHVWHNVESAMAALRGSRRGNS